MSQPTSRPTLWTILFIAFLDNLSVGILLPLVPLLLTTQDSALSILPSSFSLAQGYILFGYLLASYTIAQFFSTPILGELSDRYGRKPVLAIALSGTCVAYLLFGYAVLTQNLPLLFIARIIDGITGGNLSVAQAAIADITEPKQRAKTYGHFGAALGIGFALGPALGGFFSNSQIVSWFNATTPFWVTAILVALSVLTVIFLLPETHPPTKRTISLAFGQSIRSILDAFRQLKDRILFSGVFTWRLGFSFWTTFGAVFLIYRFNLDQTELGFYFFYIGIWLILSQAFLVPWIAQRTTSERMVTFSILITALGFLTYLIPDNWQQLLWIAPVLAMINALTLASIPAVISNAADGSTQGKYAGMSNSVQALALSIAPILSGYISASLSPIMVVIVSSVLMLVAGSIFLSYTKLIPVAD